MQSALSREQTQPSIRDPKKQATPSSRAQRNQNLLTSSDSKSPNKVTSLYVLKNPRLKYSQSTSKQKMELLSRLLDNHISKPHEDPWIALGIPPFHDSGLGLTVKEKFQDNLNNTRQRISKLKQVQGVRNFPEFKQAKEKDCLVVIEHCSDCINHEGTTRHEESQYQYTAKLLKTQILSHFPLVKVILKPVRTDPFASQQENLAARQKVGIDRTKVNELEFIFLILLGAFEIFVASSIKKSCIFSKLKSGRWPNEEQILNEISSFIPSCTLFIQISLQDFDPSKIPEESQSQPQQNKLLDIPVYLFPNRQRNINSQVVNSSSFPISKGSRPVSAMSRSSQNFLLGGDKNEKTKLKEIVGKSDKSGLVVFNNIPTETYFIEIKETNDYKSVKQFINVNQLIKDKKKLEVNVELQHFNLTFLTINAGYKTLQEESIHSLVDGIIKINPLSKSDEDDQRIPQFSKYQEQLQEEEMVDETFNGVFKVTIEPGTYLIQIEKEGYQGATQKYTALPGQQQLTLPPLVKFIQDTVKQPQDAKAKFLNRPSSSARKGILKQSDSQSRVVTANTTMNKSNLVDESYQIEGTPSSSAITPNTKTSFPPQYMNKSEQDDENIRIGEDPKMNKDTSGNDFSTQPLQNSEENNYSLEEKPIRLIEKPKSQSPSNRSIISHQSGQSSKQVRPQSSKPKKRIAKQEQEQQSASQIDDQWDEWSFNTIQKIQNQDQDLLKPPKSIKEVKLTGICSEQIISFKVITPSNELIEQSTEEISIQNKPKSKKIGLWIKEDKQFQSGIYRIYAVVNDQKLFTPSNLKLYSSQSTSSSFLQIPLLSPEMLEKRGQVVWDIGVFDVKTSKFFEINNIVKHELTRDWLLSPYENLLNFMQASRQQIKKILGFEGPDKVEIDDDVYVKKQNILESLSTYEFEGVSEIEHFLQSASNNKGFYSFKKLEVKLIHKELEKNAVRFIDIQDSRQVHQENDEDDERFNEDYFEEN